MKEDYLKINGMHDGATAIIFKNASILRSKMTEIESILWEGLKGKSLGYKIRRQHPINSYILVLVASCKQKVTGNVLHGNKTLQELYL